ncbi:hypothetical protein J3T65_07380 [Staphylococcus simiae]|uniref:Rho termination factor N-terminal domain-containing protein n=1 Tax=Staphylococcus simiae TaxID=308354 RepID=UPI001A977BC8|nr:Rho termination factor N-terminal domain-containing protein [Staphylococcus simiae]MBO1199309.1 hypothetical protein [Staphylococcus simiae]MBO1201542.1 hypothetical protein [Staphylococcus simiae]MBO1203711.1 hypothetical protein [Staphylococcus simiae]MBO1211324.1 hypothetical protein [Staphylococcus simiae]MBO1229923.1 hypothetical protein [Staphylococcus simiae]
MLDINLIPNYKINNIRKFLNLSSKAHEVQIIHESLKPENIKRLANKMTNKELQLLEDIIAKGDPAVIIDKDLVTELKITDHLGLIYQLSDEEFGINYLFLYFLNSVLFDEHNYELRDLTTEERRYIFFNVDRVQQHQNLNNVSLHDALENKTVPELKDICRTYQIKGFSNKNKDSLIDLISKEFFEDSSILNQMFVGSSLAELVMLFNILDNDKNYFIDNSLILTEEMNLLDIDDFLMDYFMYFYDYRFDALVLPQDTRQHVIDFIDKQGGPKQFLNQFNERLSDDDMLKDLQHITEYIEDNFDGDLETLGEFDGEDYLFGQGDQARRQLINELIIEIESGLIDKEDILPLRIILGAVNLYGLVTKAHLLTLMRQFYDASFSEQDLQFNLDTLDPMGLFVQIRQFVLHPLMYDLFDNDEEVEEIGNHYYIPQTVDELIYYDRYHFYKADTAIKEFIFYLRSQLITTDDIEKGNLVDQILMLIRTLPHPDLILEFMNEFVENGIMKPITNDKLFNKKAKQAWNHLRVWALQGHSKYQLK